MGYRFRERGRWCWVWTTCLYNTYPKTSFYLNVLFVFKLLSVVPTQLYNWVSVPAPVTSSPNVTKIVLGPWRLGVYQKLSSNCSSVLQLTQLCSRNLRALELWLAVHPLFPRFVPKTSLVALEWSGWYRPISRTDDTVQNSLNLIFGPHLKPEPSA